MWGHLCFKVEDFKRVSEIADNRDWSWVSLDNPRLFVNHDERRIGGGWTLKRYSIKSYLSLILDTFWWISLRVEKLDIKEEIPRGVFENIGSYL